MIVHVSPKMNRVYTSPHSKMAEIGSRNPGSAVEIGYNISVSGAKISMNLKQNYLHFPPTRLHDVHLHLHLFRSYLF